MKDRMKAGRRKLANRRLDPQARERRQADRYRLDSRAAVNRNTLADRRAARSPVTTASLLAASRSRLKQPVACRRCSPGLHSSR